MFTNSSQQQPLPLSLPTTIDWPIAQTASLLNRPRRRCSCRRIAILDLAPSPLSAVFDVATPATLNTAALRPKFHQRPRHKPTLDDRPSESQTAQLPQLLVRLLRPQIGHQYPCLERRYQLLPKHLNLYRHYAATNVAEWDTCGQLARALHLIPLCAATAACLPSAKAPWMAKLLRCFWTLGHLEH